MNIRTSMIAGCMVLALASPMMQACYRDNRPLHVPKTVVESYIMTLSCASLMASFSYFLVKAAQVMVEESRARQKRLDANCDCDRRGVQEDEHEGNDGEVEWVE